MGKEKQSSASAEEAAEADSKYYLVVYCKDKTIHLWPGDSKQECLEKLSEMLVSEYVMKRYETATIIKRDMSNFKDGLIFGKRPDVEREAKKIAGIK